MKKKLAVLFALVAIPAFAAMTYTYVGNNVWRASNGQLYAAAQGTFPPGVATWTPTVIATVNVKSAASSSVLNTPSPTPGIAYLKTNTSVVLSAGTWLLSGINSVGVSTASSAITFANFSSYWYGSDGDNTFNPPTSLTLKNGSGNSFINNAIGPGQIVGSSATHLFGNSVDSYIAVSGPTTVFLVPALTTVNPLNYEKVTTNITATLISTSTQ